MTLLGSSSQRGEASGPVNPHPGYGAGPRAGLTMVLLMILSVLIS